VILIVQLTLVDRFVGEQPFFHPENAFRLPGLLVAGLAAAYPTERLHTAVAAAGSALFLEFLLFQFSR